MKLIILLTIVTVGLVQAHKKQLDYIYFMTLGVIEAPLRYENSKAIECFHMINNEYEKVTKNLHKAIYDDSHVWKRKYHNDYTIHRFTGNLKVFVEELTRYQKGFQEALNPRNYTLLNELHWECRKNMELHYSNYEKKLKVTKNNHNSAAKEVGGSFDDLFQAISEEIRPISKTLSDCLKNVKCKTIIEGIPS